MRVAGFIANRIAFNRPGGTGGRRSFSRFIIRLSTVATVISVAVMIVTLAFANGFQATISQKVFSFWGHIRIQERQPGKALIAEETPIYADDSLVRQIQQLPQIKSIHPFATRNAILKATGEIEGILLKGFDKSYDFNNLQPFILEGRPIQFNDSSYSLEIMISAYTARQLKLKVNDRPILYFIRPPSDTSDISIRPRKVTIAGIFKTGIEEYDKIFAIGDIGLIRRLNDWEPDEIGGYEIFLHDYSRIDASIKDIYDLDAFPPTWEPVSVKSISPNIFDWLNMQDVTRDVLIAFMVIVAVINLITCLLILVLERIRMIGILKSLGATDWTVQQIFLRHSLIITITGIVIGALFGLGILYLQQYTGFIKLPEEAYYLDAAAVKIIWWQVAAICVGTLIVCFLVLMIPSLLVKKVQPVRAIHFR